MSGTDVRFFAESAHVLRRDYRPGAQPVAGTVHRRGSCTETHDGRGHVAHRFNDVHTPPTGPGRRVAPEVAQAALDAWEQPLFTPDERVDKVLSELARAGGVDITLACLHQHVVAGTEEAVVPDERLVCTVEVSAATEPGQACSEVVPWPTTLDPAVAGEAVARAAETVLERRALPLVRQLPDRCDLVLLPGRGGSFFHELIGHPMEADIVLSATSYLSARQGQRIAPEWLTAVDGACGPGDGFRAAIDDEGTVSRNARLVDGGVVGEAMTDLATAGLLGVSANGHGRRLDYRHPAVPRMTHTRALIEGDPEPRTPHGPWIAPLDLQLLTMNIATGEFHFRSSAPLLHHPDGRAYRLPPLDLRGQGTSALAGLEPYDPASRDYGRASKGCGKLGQFPLVVSFANAGVLLPAGLLDLREARDE
ncbi:MULTISPECIES: metallopeptidase TldD-related protein [unclassified Streptomyces]|uniref:metallopeptidase TldD-related protein n=1 Tax=unclassified Streptomyces TaxID=2593676 RepID=UPI003328F5FB